MNTIALIDNLIKEHYPKLHNLTIVIDPDNDKLVGAISLSPFGILMVLNRTAVAQMCDIDVLTGLILHEFEHADYVLSLPYWRRIIFAFKYLTHSGYIAEEDRVERVLRDKGFGTQMRKLLEWRYIDA